MGILMPATDIAAMTPMLPEVQGRIPGDLRDLSVELARATSRLSGMLAPQVRMEIAGALEWDSEPSG